MREAKRTADSEREEKAILCQWLNGYGCYFYFSEKCLVLSWCDTNVFSVHLINGQRRKLVFLPMGILMKRTPILPPKRARLLQRREHILDNHNGHNSTSSPTSLPLFRSLFHLSILAKNTASW